MEKRKLLLLLCMLLSLAVQAQTATGHLKFKGVPMDGPVDEFVEKIKGTDLQVVDKFDDATMLTGTFAGYRNCKVFVYPSKGNGHVRMVGVTFDLQETWPDLYSNYLSLKTMLTKKYGEPAKCKEVFDWPSEPDDHTKIYLVQTDRCKYSSDFETLEGFITLSITHLKVDYLDVCFVSVTYIDKQNFQEDQSSAMDDL